MEINVFDIPVKLSATMVAFNLCPAGHIPDADKCGDSIVYYPDVLESDHAAYDVIVKSDDYGQLAAELGEYHNQGLTVLAVALSNTNILLRLYRTSDWPCVEHPEIFMYSPVGMYHCPHCGEMQVAGTFHLPKSEENLSDVAVT